MFKHFQDYYWKGGKPYGRSEVNPATTAASYKVIVDPYFKRFSVEKYHYTQFDKIIYDSILLDFRHLTLKDQMAWQREILKEEMDLCTCLLRNQDDRAILLETLLFKENQCRECITRSIHGVVLSVHRMFYRHFQDHFDGVALYDNEEHLVMVKVYESDPFSGEFTNLLLEQWDMQTYPTLDTLLESV